MQRISRVAVLLVIGAVIYVLSSGPIIATGFWLREQTNWDGFYGVVWLYYPLLAPGHWWPMSDYIEWWVKLFGTVGPG